MKGDDAKNAACLAAVKALPFPEASTDLKKVTQAQVSGGWGAWDGGAFALVSEEVVVHDSMGKGVENIVRGSRERSLDCVIGRPALG